MIIKEFNHSVGVSGSARLKLKNGNKLKFKNTTTNKGLSEIAYAMIDKSMPQYWFAVGDVNSNITPNQIALQTAMQSELVRHSADTLSVELDIDNNYFYNVESEFGASKDVELNANPSKVLRELGLFNRAVGGDMFARASTSAPFTMDFQSLYEGDWTIKVNVQDMITSGGIVYGGSKIICNSLMKVDKELDNVLTYYSNNYFTASQSPNIAFTPAPWGLNLISLGDSGNPSDINMLDLISPKELYDSPPTITRLDLTGEASNVNYEAKLIIQKYIKPNTIPFIIKEAGLFNNRFRRTQELSNKLNISRNLFSRVVLDVPIPANAEAVLKWVIGFKR